MNGILHNKNVDFTGIESSYFLLGLLSAFDAWNEESMSLKHKLLCKMLQKVVAKQDPNAYEPWQKELLSAMGQKQDWTDKKYLEPIITFISTI